VRGRGRGGEVKEMEGERGCVPVSHNHRSISSSLLESVVPDSIGFVEVGSPPQDRKFGVHVAVYAGD
jgi:hypothetical protein